MIRAVLFDWSGTIVRSDALPIGLPAEAVAGYASSRLGLSLSAADVERAFHAASATLESRSPTPRVEDLISTAFSWLGCAVGANDVDACCRLFFREAVHGQQVYDDARALLPSLRYRGYRLAVVANEIFPARFLQVQATELGLSGYLDAIVTSADVGLAKPHPAAFFPALETIRVDPHEALYVGDTVDTDIAGARAAGMRAVLVDRRSRPREAAGYLVIPRLGALNDFLGESTITP